METVVAFPWHIFGTEVSGHTGTRTGWGSSKETRRTEGQKTGTPTSVVGHDGSNEVTDGDVVRERRPVSEPRTEGTVTQSEIQLLRLGLPELYGNTIWDLYYHEWVLPKLLVKIVLTEFPHTNIL